MTRWISRWVPAAIGRALIPAAIALSAAAAAAAPPAAPPAVSPAASSAAAAKPDWAAALRLAEAATVPEPLARWTGLEDAVERLVARGELPLEAATFKPVDRGELAAWLLASDPCAGTTHARRRVEELLRWEILQLGAHRTGGAHGADSIPARRERPWSRPGSLLHTSDGRRDLVLGPYLQILPTWREGDRWSWSDSTRVGLRGVLACGSQLVFAGGLYAAEVDRGRAFADPLVAGTDWILHEEEITLSARVAGLRLRAGRDRHRWGPGVTGTLLLSDNGAPFNFAEYQVRFGERLRFLALTGATSLHQQRYLAAHRLTWTPRADLSLSLAEGARYRAKGSHLLYLAGIVPYTLVERFDLQDALDDSTRQQQRNNVLWGLDIAWRVRPAWLVHAEVLADDIGTESAETPSRGGVQLGTTWAPCWRGWDWTLGLEFTRISNFTYSVYYQDLCSCDWEHQGLPLGYAEGPDVAVLAARCAVDFSRAWSGRAWLTRIGRGEGRLGTAWQPSTTGCDPGTPGCGDVPAWSLSGAVRTVWTLGLAWEHRWGAFTRAGLWGEAGCARDAIEGEERAWSARGGLIFSAGMR